MPCGRRFTELERNKMVPYRTPQIEDTNQTRCRRIGLIVQLTITQLQRRTRLNDEIRILLPLSVEDSSIQFNEAEIGRVREGRHLAKLLAGKEMTLSNRK